MSSLIKGVDQLEYYECTDALDDYGYVLKFTSTGKVAKAAAGDPALGVNYKSTKNPVTDVAEANKVVAVVKYGIAWVQFNTSTTDSTINIGDLVSTKGANVAGTVKKHSWTTGTAVEHTTTIAELQMIVGTALETKAPGTSGKLKCMLHPGRLR